MLRSMKERDAPSAWACGVVTSRDQVPRTSVRAAGADTAGSSGAIGWGAPSCGPVSTATATTAAATSPAPPPAASEARLFWRRRRTSTRAGSASGRYAATASPNPSRNRCSTDIADHLLLTLAQQLGEAAPGPQQMLLH